MEQKNLEKLLNELPRRMIEPVRSGLAEDIKGQIPQQLHTHKMGMDTINIIIDLRISRLAAAAVIIITIVFCANFFGVPDSTNGGIIETIGYSLAGDRAARSRELIATSSLYESMLEQGKEVVYYGNNIDWDDSNAVLMHWKLPNGKYKVIFSDFRVMTISADVLVILQAQMVQDKTRN